MKIIKRNGDVQQFNKDKIVNAIKKAKKEKNSNILDEVIFKIADTIESKVNKLKKEITVEDIQDMVVKSLMVKDKDLAISYQTYRIKRENERELKIQYEIAGLIKADKDLVNENANKDSNTVSVKRDLLAGIGSRNYYLNNIIPKKIRKAYESGYLHLHDLDYLLFKETNCELVNLERMLKGGCKIGNAKMSEPKRIDVAVDHTIQIIASVSSNTYGGCTIPYIDKTLIPYVRKTFIEHMNIGLKYIENAKEYKIDNNLYFETENEWKKLYSHFKKNHLSAYNYAVNMTEESVKQAMQGLEYEINSLSTVNGQTPFTTIGFGTETCWEGKLIQKYILMTRMNGFGALKEVAVFPKLVYTVCEGLNFNPEDPNYDILQLAMKCMSTSIYPDIIFPTKEQVDNGTVVYPMGCRAYLSPWFDENGKEIYAGRFNIGATSINLVRIAIENKGNEKTFYKKLDEILEICKENSVFRANYLKDTTSDEAPILWQSGALAELKPGETIEKLIFGGYCTVSIGYIGLSEVSELLYGENFAHSEEIYKKTYAILQHLADKVAEFKKETNLGFALYATPSESLCYKFCKKDDNDFGHIEGITQKGYYDNSFHVSSAINISPFEKMRLEAPAHKISWGGHISYIESASLKKNNEAIYDILKYAKNIGIHYFGINQPVDSCHECGYKGEFTATENGFTCPKCGNHDGTKMNVIRRVCGYLSEPDARPFNNGKQKEVIARVKHGEEL